MMMRVLLEGADSRGWLEKVAKRRATLAAETYWRCGDAGREDATAFRQQSRNRDPAVGQGNRDRCRDFPTAKSEVAKKEKAVIVT